MNSSNPPHPYHDWNQRILFECYRPNSCARIVAPSGKIVRILNNYEWINFNFGPTLIDWLHVRAPVVYQRIIQADGTSRQRWGHGNAIAQVYNHMIMPLADKRDRNTQIYWGKINFLYHFGRAPQGMWLAETAINNDTVQDLIEHGIGYTILAPHQAQRIRCFGSKTWSSVSEVGLDVSQPYRIFAKGPHGEKITDKWLDVFFYHGDLAHEISFNSILTNSKLFCDAFGKRITASSSHIPLIHAATDGEVYGHHRKFGDLTLAHALDRGLADAGFELTNYAAYLNRFPPTSEVELNNGADGEGTSWSCAHGVGRWKENCGCQTGGKPDWNQLWRTPLREALDNLRDRLRVIFEIEGGKYFINPWRARDKYIHVIMNRSREASNRFFEQEGVHGLSESHKLSALKLMEMQRHAMLMYTSCAWFFSDISGIETVQVLQYAHRAIELARDFSKEDIEIPFISTLEKAKSNIRRENNGKSIFLRHVKPSIITFEKVVHHAAVSSLLMRNPDNSGMFRHYTIQTLNHEQRIVAGRILAMGRVRIRSHIIPKEKTFIFALLVYRDRRLRTSVRIDNDETSYLRLVKKLFAGLKRMPLKIDDVINHHFVGPHFSFEDFCLDYKRMILEYFIKNGMDDYAASGEGVFHDVCHAVGLLEKEGLAPPEGLEKIAYLTLNRRFEKCLESLNSEPDSVVTKSRLHSIWKEARHYHTNLEMKEANRVFSEIIETGMKKFQKNLSKDLCQSIMSLLDLAQILKVNPDLTESQNYMYSLLTSSISSYSEAGQIPQPIKLNDIEWLKELASKLNFETDTLE